MAFDTAGAIAAGYTQDEINNYLKSKKKETLISKLSNAPMVGGLIKTGTDVAMGNMDNTIGKGVQNKIENRQAESLALARQAQTEKDPIKRKELLDQSRAISGETGDVSDKYYGYRESVTPWTQGKETPNTIVDKGKSYGMQALETGSNVGEIIGTGELIKGGVQLVKNGPKIVKTATDKLNFAKTFGEEAKKIAKDSGKKVSSKEIMSKAFVKLEEQGLSGSAKEKAINELQKLAKDAPSNIFDTLTKRRGADKMITRNLFGVPKTGSGKNVAVAVYRSALDDVIKGIPELASLDRKISIFYKVKDPIVNLISNRLVQAGGLGWGLSKIMGK